MLTKEHLIDAEEQAKKQATRLVQVFLTHVKQADENGAYDEVDMDDHDFAEEFANWCAEFAVDYL
jgi:hypothetical protein